MTTERDELHESAWSVPPDQGHVRPTERKIGEGALSDGPNGQNVTPPSRDMPRISRDPEPDDDMTEA